MRVTIEKINSGAAYRLYNGKTALTVARGRLVDLEHKGKRYLFDDPNRIALLSQPGKWEAKIVDTHLEMASEVGPEGCQIHRKFFLGEAFLLSESIRNVSGQPQGLAPSIVLTFPTPASIKAHYLNGAPQVPQNVLRHEGNNIFSLSLYPGKKRLTTGLDFNRDMGGIKPLIEVKLDQNTPTLSLYMESGIAHYSSGFPAEVFAQGHSFQLGFSGQAATLYPGQESAAVSVFGVL
jgi:hypothetical protein